TPQGVEQMAGQPEDDRCDQEEQAEHAQEQRHVKLEKHRREAPGNHRRRNGFGNGWGGSYRPPRAAEGPTLRRTELRPDRLGAGLQGRRRFTPAGLAKEVGVHFQTLSNVWMLRKQATIADRERPLQQGFRLLVAPLRQPKGCQRVEATGDTWMV